MDRSVFKVLDLVSEGDGIDLRSRLRERIKHKMIFIIDSSKKMKLKEQKNNAMKAIVECLACQKLSQTPWRQRLRHHPGKSQQVDHR